MMDAYKCAVHVLSESILHSPSVHALMRTLNRRRYNSIPKTKLWAHHVAEVAHKQANKTGATCRYHCLTKIVCIFQSRCLAESPFPEVVASANCDIKTDVLQGET